MDSDHRPPAYQTGALTWLSYSSSLTPTLLVEMKDCRDPLWEGSSGKYN